MCVQHGHVMSLQIPRPPAPGAPNPPGLGKVVIEYAEIDSAVKAHNAMHGRRFAGRTVNATFVQEGEFSAGQLD